MPTFKHPCPHCGKYINRDVAVCPYCATPDPFAPARCPNCRTVIDDPAWAACPRCGQSLKAGSARTSAGQPSPAAQQAADQALHPVTAQPAAQAAPAPQPGPQPQPAGASNCTGCGAPLAVGARFCTVCGTLAPV